GPGAPDDCHDDVPRDGHDGMKALRLPHAVTLPCAVAKHSAAQPREEAQQMEYIAFDAHKHYTLASVARSNGQVVREERIEHDRGALRQFVERYEPGSPVAVETIANWYWI